MPYSKWALLLFGGGLVLGLVVVSADLPVLGWVASLAMAVGVTLLPVALAADWWSHRPWKVPVRKPAGRHVPRPQAKAPSRSSPPRKRGAKGK